MSISIPKISEIQTQEYNSKVRSCCCCFRKNKKNRIENLSLLIEDLASEKLDKSELSTSIDKDFDNRNHNSDIRIEKAFKELKDLEQEFDSIASKYKMEEVDTFQVYDEGLNEINGALKSSVTQSK